MKAREISHEEAALLKKLGLSRQIRQETKYFYVEAPGKVNTPMRKKKKLPRRAGRNDGKVGGHWQSQTHIKLTDKPYEVKRNGPNGHINVRAATYEVIAKALVMGVAGSGYVSAIARDRTVKQSTVSGAITYLIDNGFLAYVEDPKSLTI